MIERWSEKLIMAFVWALPKRVVYWCVIRAAVFNYNSNPAERTVLDCCKGLEA